MGEDAALRDVLEPDDAFVLQLERTLERCAGSPDPPTAADVRARARRIARGRRRRRMAAGGVTLAALVGALVVATDRPTARPRPALDAPANLRDASLLLDAARADDHARMSELLDAGASPNASESFGITPLMVATIRGDARSVQLLLDAGAYVDANDLYGRTALAHAAAYAGPDVIERLVAAGAAPDVRLLDYERRTPLMVAAERGRTEAVTALVAAGADVELRDRIGRAAVHYALDARRSTVAATVRTLLGLGATVPGVDAPSDLPDDQLVAAVRATDPAWPT
jgi:ankyrin repeat protein